MTIHLMQISSWDQVVEDVGPRLYRYFKYKGANDQASDLVQETFIRLVNGTHRYDPKQSPMVAFALGIAQNVWRESLRKNTQTESLDQHADLASDADLHHELERLDQSEKLKKILQRLSQVQQDILYFYFDEEITTREIAEILKTPEGTVKSHLHRAKETIRIIYEKELL